MNIYQHELMDHYRSPRNHGLLTEYDFLSREHNPSCGDQVTVSGRFDANGLLQAVGFEATGCVISVATGSLLFEQSLGKSHDQIMALDSASVLQLIGIELGPTRLKCALLPLQALKQGLLSRGDALHAKLN